MEIIAQLIAIITGFISFIMILRTWFQFCRVDINLPISQSLLRMTSFAVDPVSKFVPTIKGINFAAILIAFLVLVVEKILVYQTSLPVAVLAAVLGVIKIFGQILFFVSLIRALMSWVTQGSHPLDYTVAQITEPVLGLIRKLLPRTGMLDFSVMVLGFGLLILNSLFYSVFGVLWAIA